MVSCGQEETKTEDNGPQREARLEVTSDNGLFVAAEDGASADINFKNAGGEVMVAVSTNLDDWTYTCSDESWLEVTADKHFITLSTDLNESTDKRTSVLTITAFDEAENTKEYVVNISQNYAGQPEITVSSNAVRFPAAGELSSEITVETNQDELEFDCTCQWLLVEKSETGIKLSVDKNAATDVRTVDLKLTAGQGKDAASDVIRITQDGKAYLNLSSVIAHAEPKGAEQEITFESNPELEATFSVKEGDSWYSVEKGDGKITVKITPSTDGLQRKGVITAVVGEKENTETKTIEVLQIGSDTEELIFEIQVNTAGTTYKGGGIWTTSSNTTFSVDIDWGDGTEVEHYETGNPPTHIYEKTGKYTITTKGTAPAYALSDNTYLNSAMTGYHIYHLAVISWGNLGVEEVQNACKNSLRLKSIPADVCGSFSKVTNFNNFLYTCKSLEEIPEDLFQYAVNATSFQYTFLDCSSIKAIPEGLFRNCPLVTAFEYTFSGVGGHSVHSNVSNEGVAYEIVSEGNPIAIPEKLFANNPLVTRFTQTFKDMNISDVPAKLFANQPDVTSFNGLFYGSELETLPADLFYNNVKCTDCAQMLKEAHVKTLPVGLFKNASALTQLRQFFQGALIEDIPDGFFEGLDKVTNVQELFGNAVFNKPLKSGMLKGLSAVTNANKLFYHCETTGALPSGLFEGLSTSAKSVTITDCFQWDASIKEIPADLFAPVADKVTNLTNCFRLCTGLTSIPEDLGSECTALTNISSMFYGCTGLEKLPSKFFTAAGAKITNISGIFQGCTSLTEVPDDLFGFITVVANASSAFNGCTSLKKAGARSLPKSTNLQNAFFGCTSLTDVDVDVFANSTTITSMSRTFYGCTALKSLPENLFAANVKVTKFEQVFYGCTALTSVPEGLFAKNTAATAFTEVFYGCTALASVPENLFSANTKVTNFKNLFCGCTSLSTIPAGLFAKNTAVTSFYGVFVGCEKITEIPATLFATNTKAYDFQYTFSGTAIESVPEGLFDKLPAASQSVTFGYSFYLCTNLKTVPVNLFDVVKKAKSFNYCFYGCTALTGESPYTEISGTKVHLYERKTMNSSVGNVFYKSITGTGCFSGCTGLSDYDSITSGWK